MESIVTKFIDKEVLISDIKINSDRKRDLGDVEELAENIKIVGLLQPIVLTNDLTLLAGERRLSACKLLCWKRIPARIVENDLDAPMQKQIELIENIARKNFAWHEEVAIKEKIHSYWQKEAEMKSLQWGIRKTAKRLRIGSSALSTDLVLASAIRCFPELKTCGNKQKAREAYKKIAQKAEAMIAIKKLPQEQQDKLNKMLKISPEKQILPKAKYADEETLLVAPPKNRPKIERSSDKDTKSDDDQNKFPQHTYDIISYEKFIPKIPDSSVGFIELDPPYGINYYTNLVGENKGIAKSTDWTPEQLKEFYTIWLPVLYKKLLPTGWIFVWCSKESWQMINSIAHESDFHIQDPGVWVKKTGSTNKPSMVMTSRYETFLLLRKGNITFNTPSFANVIEVDATTMKDRSHNWEKPLSLYAKIFKAFSQDGSIFLSPFAGSGNSLIAAAKFNMIPMGCDIEDKYLYFFYEKFANNYFGINNPDDIKGD